MAADCPGPCNHTRAGNELGFEFCSAVAIWAAAFWDLDGPYAMSFRNVCMSPARSIPKRGEPICCNNCICEACSKRYPGTGNGLQ